MVFLYFSSRCRHIPPVYVAVGLTGYFLRSKKKYLYSHGFFVILITIFLICDGRYYRGLYMGLRQWFTPPDREFFNLLEQQAAIVTLAGHQLVDLTKDFTDVKVKRHAIEQLEHKGDDLTHAIFERLNRSENPPLAATEISALTSSLDEVLDYIDGSAEKMLYYGIESPDVFIIELAKVIHLSAVEIEGAVKGIRSIKIPIISGNAASR